MRAMPDFLPAGFDDFVTMALQQWQTPGAAIALVQDDEVVFARGYGERRLGSGEPVDANTVFGIGSATKAFTAAVVAALVGAGELGWDDLVITHAPEFRLSDPWMTQEITVRDLLCHRTGLPRGIGMRLRSDCDLATYMARMQRVRPLYSFRARYHYTNTSFDWAGMVAARAAGMSWAELVRQRIFNPLGMTSASTNADALAGVANLSTPHAQIDGVVQPVPWRNIGDDPAGSINASALDMAQWLRLQLNGGAYAGAQIIPVTAAQEMHLPQVAVPHPETTEIDLVTMLQPPTNLWTYGLGWWVQDWRGRKLVWHGGQIDGNAAMVALLPEARFGLVVLTNIHVTLLHGVLMFMLLDARLGCHDRDWNGDALHLAAQFAAHEAEQAAARQAARRPNTRPSLPLAAYAGVYASSWCGELTVTNAGDGLTVEYGRGGVLTHWRHDTFELTWRDRMLSPDLVTFSLDASGQPMRLNIEGLDEFVRVSQPN